MDLFQRDLRFGSEDEALRHPRLGPTGRIASPALGQVEFEGNRQAGQIIGSRQRHGDLAVLWLAQLAAILARHPDRVLTLLGKSGVIDDPGGDRALSPQGGQHRLADRGQHRRVAPRRRCNKVVQRLVQAGHVGWVEARRHRLNALALAGQQQAGAVVENPLFAVGMA